MVWLIWLVIPTNLKATLSITYRITASSLITWLPKKQLCGLLFESKLWDMIMSSYANDFWAGDFSSQSITHTKCKNMGCLMLSLSSTYFTLSHRINKKALLFQSDFSNWVFKCCMTNICKWVASGMAWLIWLVIPRSLKATLSITYRITALSLITWLPREWLTGGTDQGKWAVGDNNIIYMKTVQKAPCITGETMGQWYISLTKCQ